MKKRMNFKAVLSIAILLLVLTPIAGAITWKKTSLGTGNEAGNLCATTVDRAGRVHTVYSVNNGTVVSLRYSMRTSGTVGFTTNSIVGTFGGGAIPKHLAMDVASDFTVQVAVIRDDGILRVYERDSSSSTVIWTFRPVAGLAVVTSKGGVSIRSRGDSGALNSAIAFCGGTGNARYVEQQGGGNWGSVFSVTTGTNTGLAPVLAFAPGLFGGQLRRVVTCYNEADEEVQALFMRQSGLGGFNASAPESIRSAPNFTRPDLERMGETFGVSLVVLGSASEASNGIFYASRKIDSTPGSTNAWATQQVTPSTEVNPDNFESFGIQTALASDAAGSPWVVYSRSAFPLLVGRTLDIRANRLIPGRGWESSIVETFSGAGLGFNFTGFISLDAGANGDPSLCYERDSGADSTFVFSRPSTDPWVVGKPDELNSFSNTYAPALAAGPDGKHHLITSSTQGGLFITPLSHQPPSVLTFSGNSTTREALPSSNNPHLANAIVTEPDGTIHAASLRVVSPGDTDGDILVFSKAPGDSFQFRGLATGDAAVDRIALDVDASGKLYVAFKASDGTATIRTLERGETGSREWQNLTMVSAASVQGMDLAVRGDGGVVLSFFDPADSAGIVKVWSNVDPRRGIRFTTFEAYQVYALSSREAHPQNTACLIHADGRPRVSFALRGPLKYCRPAGIGFLDFVSRNPTTGLLDATIDMVAKGNAIHVTAQTSRDDGSLVHIQFDDLSSGVSRISTPFSSPGLDLSGRGAVTVSTTLDQFGSPIMAASLRVPASLGIILFPSTDHSVVMRPADALDEDGDGIPLLLEEAHCLNRDEANSKFLLAQGRVRRFGSGKINISHSYRFPSVPTAFENQGIQAGEFTYRYQVGNELIGWEVESSGPDVESLLFFLTPVSGEIGCQSSGIGYGYFPANVTANPERYSRLQIVRDR